MTRASVPGVAGERIPHGSPARIDRAGVLWIERDRGQMDGVTRRTNGRDAIDQGEPGDLLTDGGILAELEPGRIQWVDLRRGRIFANG